MVTEKSCNLSKSCVHLNDQEVEPVETVQVNIYKSNTYIIIFISWLHFDNEPRVQ